MSTKRIVIMGKSAKMYNYCVAGFSVDDAKWSRPVSCNPAIQEAVPRNAMFYSDGSRVQTFDIVEIQCADKPPDNLIQPENFYYDESYRWKKVGETSLEKILNWRGFDSCESIFYNNERSVSPDYIKTQNARKSLLLLPITNLTVKVERYDDYPKYYANFNYMGKRYWRFSVGDIEVRDYHKDKAFGEYHFRDKAIAIFSLTNPFYLDNKCYKMLAHVF